MSMHADDLHAIRIALGKTPDKFAKALGMTRKAITEMEAGNARIERRTELAALYLRDHPELFVDLF